MRTTVAMASGCWVLAVLGTACGEKEPASAPAPTAEESRPSSVLLVTMDTTRADALGCFGGQANVTPHLDAFAKKAVAYVHARTVAPLTLPAHASMMTGLYPPRHSVRDNSLSRLPDAVTTLAEEARDAGLQTGAFVAAAVLDSAYGLDQGFDVYDQPPRAADNLSSHYGSRPARVVIERAIDWVQMRDPTRPFFLWVHLFDPHVPLRPSERFLEQAGGNPYLGEVAFVDHELNRLFEAFGAALDETLVAVVADHGEGMRQHGEHTHGVFCWDTTIRVPFLVKYPDGWGAGTRVTDAVSVVDLRPTIRSAWGLPDEPSLDGVNLRQPIPLDRGVYFESYYGHLNHGWSPLVGWAERDGKVIFGASPAKVYDIRTDPLEQQNVAEQSGDVIERARSGIETLVARKRWEGDESVDPALLEQLRTLGYAAPGTTGQTLPEPLAATDRPDPHDRLQELNKYLRGVKLTQQGEVDAAIRLYERVVEQNPKNVAVLTNLSALLIHQVQYERAREILEQMHAQGFERSATWNNLGYCLSKAEEWQAAVTAYQRSLELDDGQVQAAFGLRDALRALGREDEAAAVEEGLKTSGSR